MTSKEETPPADAGRGLSEGLGLLPEPDVPLVRGGCYTEALVLKIVAEKVAAERERWAAICRGVMAEHGGDPAGQLVDYGNRDRLVAQCQAAGASQVLIRGLGA